MSIELVHIGFNNILVINRVVAIASPNSAPTKRIIQEGGFATKIIVGSIRKPEDVDEAALAGAHIITIPYKILIQMPLHPKTEETIKEFDQAWLEFKRAESG